MKYRMGRGVTTRGKKKQGRVVGYDQMKALRAMSAVSA